MSFFISILIFVAALVTEIEAPAVISGGLFVLGYIGLIGYSVYGMVISILAAIDANKGGRYRFSLVWQVIK